MVDHRAIMSLLLKHRSYTEITASAKCLSIRRFGDHPLLPLGASDIAVGGQYLPGREPPVPNGPGYAWTAPVFSLML
ncbi:hypothetical protein J2S64_003605 [Paeniglutamicibacter sulfureus]|uniref:Uncharacterized protein n=1 Tax=Paeniglutamicibacter sulfureus TaxID=43666 RepID=A0ABU2BRB0_9MICC|nr:hypothetical protein [Paeniglutamicibacter sulfureus]